MKMVAEGPGGKPISIVFDTRPPSPAKAAETSSAASNAGSDPIAAELELFTELVNEALEEQGLTEESAPVATSTATTTSPPPMTRKIYTDKITTTTPSIIHHFNNYIFSNLNFIQKFRKK